MLRRQHPDHAGDEGAKPDVEQGGAQRLVLVHQRTEAKDGIEADLGHHGKDRGHRSQRDRVRPREPEVEGPACGLDQKGDAQNGRARIEEGTIVRGQRRSAARQIRHVERTGDAIDQSDAEEKEE